MSSYPIAFSARTNDKAAVAQSSPTAEPVMFRSGPLKMSSTVNVACIDEVVAQAAKIQPLSEDIY